MLSKKIREIPPRSGVYIFKDKTGRILYVGKAVDLRNRVRSHFAKTSSIFSQQFIGKITDIDWIATDNEKQAYLLENELIKKYKPRYNIQWRDDKSYFYVIFTQEDWPRVLITHQKQVGKKSSIYNLQFSIPPIGPFVNGRELRRLLRALRKILPYRTCKNPYNKPCLQWHLGLCPAHSLKSKIKNQKSKLQLKNYINLLRGLSQFLRLYIGEPIRLEAYDISNIHGVWATGSMIVFYGDKPHKDDYRRFKIKTVRSANDVAMIKEVLKRRFNHPEWPYPDLILIDGGKAQLNAARLKIVNCKLKIPLFALAKRGDKIYTEYSNKTVKLSALPIQMRLVFQAIRNEAHRFAIFYYRHLHEKQYKPGRISKKIRAEN